MLRSARTTDGGPRGRPGQERVRRNWTFRRGLICAVALVFAGIVLLVGVETVGPEDTQRSSLSDVGNNCDPACMLGALGAAMGDPWGRRAAEREWNQYRHRRGEFFRDNPQRADRDEWYEQNPRPDVEEPGGDLILFTEMAKDWTEAIFGEVGTRGSGNAGGGTRD